MNDKQGNPLGLALLVGLGVLWFAVQPPNSTTPATTTPVVALGADANLKLATVRTIAARNPAAAKRLGLLLGAAGEMIRADTSTITTTEQLFRFLERAERFNTSPDGVAKLPGIGAAVSDVLKSPDVLGSKVAPLDVAKRKASADALKIIADSLRGG